MKRFIIISICGFLFLGCHYRDNYLNKVYEKEKNNSVAHTREIIEDLGLEHFKISAYPRKSITPKPVSKQVTDTRYYGNFALPENLILEDAPAPDTPGQFSHVSQKTLFANYETKAKREILYGGIYILIIFDEINVRQIAELDRIIRSTVLNPEMGDDVYIVSKDAFSKLKTGNPQ